MEEILIGCQLESIPLYDLSTATTQIVTMFNELVEIFPMQEILGLNQALQRNRGELVNSLAELSLLDEPFTIEKEKLTEARYKFSCKRIAVRLRDLEDEPLSYLKAGAANREAFEGRLAASVK